MQDAIQRLFATAPLAILAFGLALPAGCGRDAAEESGDGVKGGGSTEDLPETVAATLYRKFPEAVVASWSAEDEHGARVYDIEFEVYGRTGEADIGADGRLINWEEAISEGELPEVVRLGAERQYPNSTLKEIMRITAVVAGADSLEGYEITLESEAGEMEEITVGPDGLVVEDSGSPEEEEGKEDGGEEE